MSVHSLKRSFLLAAAAVFVAGIASAATPGARYETRMVYDASVKRIILFGGTTAIDAGTRVSYDLDDTWEWNGSRWVERFLDVHPSKRSAHMMVYDSNHSRTILFGGHNALNYYNDTWSYQNGVWTQINTPNQPEPRVLSGAAFDPIRDRMVIYGGTSISADQKTTSPLYDTWEFDGTTWKKSGSEGPQIAKPILVYDRKHNQILMLGIDSSITTHMYQYNNDGTWKELKPANPVPCANEGELAYDTTRDVVMYTGGTCTTTGTLDETFEWDGSDWTKVTLTSAAPRLFGAALAYDEAHQYMVMYGGYSSTSTVSATYLYTAASTAWLSTGDQSPSPRSLGAFSSDPETPMIWLFGGVNITSEFDDFWSYRNGHFESQLLTDGPTSCGSPVSAYDTNRHRLVLVCISSEVWEFDPAMAKWGLVAPGTKDVPPQRRFSSFTYDDNLKKVVLFGGHDGTNYIDQTWTWDGKTWVRVKKNPAPSRGLASMWYDPTLKRTVIYGGIGRLTSQDRITRYNDMWSFDGTGWTEINPTTLPGARYGAASAVDPRNGHLLLFGGLQLIGSGDAQQQVYAGDTWDWDGKDWKKLTPSGAPPARENAALAFDYLNNQFVMFGGYGGYYLSDIWTFDQNTWRPKPDATVRRRASH
jgi:hypothetical protein